MACPMQSFVLLIVNADADMTKFAGEHGAISLWGADDDVQQQRRYVLGYPQPVTLRKVRNFFAHTAGMRVHHCCALLDPDTEFQHRAYHMLFLCDPCTEPGAAHEPELQFQLEQPCAEDPLHTLQRELQRENARLQLEASNALASAQASAQCTQFLRGELETQKRKYAELSSTSARQTQALCAMLDSASRANLLARENFAATLYAAGKYLGKTPSGHAMAVALDYFTVQHAGGNARCSEVVGELIQSTCAAEDLLSFEQTTLVLLDVDGAMRGTLLALMGDPYANASSLAAYIQKVVRVHRTRTQ